MTSLRGSMEEKVVQTKAGYLTIGEDGIIRFRITPGAIVDVEVAEKCIAGAAELAGDRKHILLIDMRGLRSITREARHAYTTGPTTAVALLIGSPVGKAIGNFFIALNKPAYPLKMFTSETEAVNWLKVYVE